MKLSELETGLMVRYRIGKTGTSGIRWEPWKEGPIVVRKYDEEENVIWVVPRGSLSVDFGEKDYVGNGVFSYKNYHFEIEGLTSDKEGTK